MNDEYADSDFLAKRDLAVSDFRTSEKETKHKIIEKMLTLRHNMKYNKHLLSVYIRAKGLFDTMIEEHRSQLYYLDEIYRHINQLIRENLSTVSKKSSGIMSELVKDKKRIGTLLKKMRGSYDKLMNVDTVIGVTIDKMNEITFMEDDDAAGDEYLDEDDERLDESQYKESDEEEDSVSEEDEEDSVSEEEEEDSVSEDEADEEDSASEDEADEEDSASEDEAVGAADEADEDSASEDEADSASEEEDEDPVILLY
jgi:hypothetical protein